MIHSDVFKKEDFYERSGFCRLLFFVFFGMLIAVGGFFAVNVHSASAETYTVNNLGFDPDFNTDGVCETADGNSICTIQAAIDEANGDSGATTILFDVSLNGGTISYTSDNIDTITTPVTITGPGVANLTLDASAAAVPRAFRILGSAGVVSISGFTITGSTGISALPSGSTVTNITADGAFEIVLFDGADNITITNNTLTGNGALVQAFFSGSNKTDNTTISDNVFSSLCNNNPAMYLLSAGDNVAINNNTITYCGSGAASGISATVLGNNLTIDSNTISSVTGAGIAISPATTVDTITISNNTITDVDGSGISVVGFGGGQVVTSLFIDTNTVTNAGDASNEYGIILREFAAGSTATVSNNTETGSAGCGGGVVNVVGNMAIIGNTFSSNTAGGMLFSSVNGVTSLLGNTSSNNSNVALGFIDIQGELIIDGNTISNNGGTGYGVYLTTTTPGSPIITTQGTFSNNTITNNLTGIYLNYGYGITVRDNTISGNDQVGILINTADLTPISGNTLDANGYGIEILSSGAEDAAITGNTITNSDRGDSTGAGIYIADAGAGLTIGTNTISNSTSYGIWVAASGGMNVTDNTISGSGTYGVYVQEGSEIDFSGNTVSGNGIAPTFFYHTDPLTLTFGGNQYDDGGGINYFYDGSGGPGQFQSVNGADTEINLADGFTDFNLALIHLPAAGFYASVFVDASVITSAGDMDTDCETWGAGSCTVDVWVPSAWQAPGAEEADYTWDSAAIAAASVSVSGTPRFEYTSRAYVSGGYLIDNGGNGSINTFNNETIAGNGFGIRFNSNVQSQTISDSTFSSLGTDIYVNTGSTITSDNSGNAGNGGPPTYAVDGIGALVVKFDATVRVLTSDDDVSSLDVLVVRSDAEGSSFGSENTDENGYLNNGNPVSYTAFEAEESGVTHQYNPYSFQLTSGGHTVTRTASIIEPNQAVTLSLSSAPYLIDVIPNQTWDEDTSKINAFDLDDYFVDPDHGALTYIFTTDENPQITATIDGENQVSFVPAENWNGSLNFSFIATDSENLASTSPGVTMTVTPVNDPPEPPTETDSDVFDPRENATVTTLTPTISWPEAIDIDNDASELKYTLRLGTATDPTVTYTTEATTDFDTTSEALMNSLTNGTPYYYTVKTIDQDDAESDWSEIQSFTVDTSVSVIALTKSVGVNTGVVAAPLTKAIAGASTSFLRSFALGTANAATDLMDEFSAPSRFWVIFFLVIALAALAIILLDIYQQAGNMKDFFRYLFTKVVVFFLVVFHLTKHPARAFEQIYERSKHGTFMDSFAEFKRDRRITLYTLAGAVAFGFAKVFLVVAFPYLALHTAGPVSASPYEDDGTTVTSQDTLTYRIDWDSADTTSTITLADTMPAGTAYVPGSLVLNGTAQTDADDGDDATFSSSAGQALFTLTSGSYSATGYALFQASVNTIVEATIITNQGVARVSGSTVAISNTTSNPFTPSGNENANANGNINGNENISVNENTNGGVIGNENSNGNENTNGNENENVNAVLGINENGRSTPPPLISRILPDPLTRFIDAVTEFYRTIRSNAIVQFLNTAVVTPAITVAVLANLLAALPAATSLLDFLRYLFQLLTSPFSYLAKGSIKQWGTVYDIFTKLPVDLAVVRLVNADSGKLVETRVTGTDGRYSFLAPHGNYTLHVTKPNYVFPAESLKGATQDNPYLSLYFGNVINLTHADRSSGVITLPAGKSPSSDSDVHYLAYDIPMELIPGALPASLTHTRPLMGVVSSLSEYQHLAPEQHMIDNTKVARRERTKRFSYIFSLLGLVIGLFTFLVSPGWYTSLAFLANICLFLLFLRLAKERTSPPWGVIRDAATGTPLKGAIVRLFDKLTGRLLLVTVTHGDGKYSFLVGNHPYILSVEHPSYTAAHEIPIQGAEAGLVKQDVEMVARGA